MTRLTSIITLALTILLSSALFGQGRVDTDPILYNIWWTSWKISKDTSLKYVVRKHTGSPNKITEIKYFKADTLCKVLVLTKTSDGTEMSTFYFANRKTILISVERNNFVLSDDEKDIFKVVNSFDIEGDTLVNNKAVYLNQYQASYYFYKDSVRFAAVVTYSNKGLVKNVRHDNKDDIHKGMILLNTANQYLVRRE